MISDSISQTLIIIFELLAVISGTIAIASPKFFYPKIKYHNFELSASTDYPQCRNIYRFFLFWCYLLNTIASFLYIGPLGLLFFVCFISLFTRYGSKVHLLSSSLAFLLYALESVIYRPDLVVNYFPLLGYLLTVYTFTKNHSNALGLIW
jgi:hypothetical protein